MEPNIIKSPEVSVIIPVHNGEDFIAEAISSVQKQTLSSLEIIVVDDASTDNTRREVLSLAAIDQRIRYYHIDHSGSSKARNHGFEMALGNYIAVLDADDIWPPEKLEIQTQALKDKVDAIAVGQVQRFTVGANGDQKLGKISRLPNHHGDYLDKILSLDLVQMVNLNTLLAPRSVIMRDGLWDPIMITAHDWENWLRLAKSYEFVHIDKVLQLYRKHGSSTTRGTKIETALHYQLLAIKRHAPKGPTHLWRRLGYRRKRHQDMIAALNHQGENRAALKLWFKACLSTNIALTASGIKQLLEILHSSRQMSHH